MGAAVPAASLVFLAPFDDRCVAATALERVLGSEQPQPGTATFRVAAASA